jgi:hypothetical protein
MMIPATHYYSFDLYIHTGGLKNMKEISTVCSFKTSSSHLQISLRRSSAATTQLHKGQSSVQGREKCS